MNLLKRATSLLIFLLRTYSARHVDYCCQCVASRDSWTENCEDLGVSVKGRLEA